MKYLGLFLIAVSFNLFSQSEVQTLNSYDNGYTFRWDGFKNNLNFQERNNFINYARTNNLLTDEINFYKSSSLKIVECIDVIDINNDQLDDVVFTGFSGGESTVVKFFLNTGTGYKLIFSCNQGLLKVDWKDNKIEKLYIHDRACCAGITVTKWIYKVNYNGNIPSFEKTREQIECVLTDKPKEYFENPIAFHTIHPNYKIRFQPKIDNETFINSDLNAKSNGNIVGLIKKESKGYAYGKQTDSTGRIWYYVEMKSEYLNDNSLTYLPLKSGVKIMGWISSRYIKEE